MKNGEVIKNKYANRNTPDPRQTFLIAAQQVQNSSGDLCSRLRWSFLPLWNWENTPAGKSRVFTVSGAQFVGDRLRGEVLPQARSDLLLVRDDGSSQQDVRLSLRTERLADSHDLLWRAPCSGEINARIARGEPVAPSDYLQTSAFFETSTLAEQDCFHCGWRATRWTRWHEAWLSTATWYKVSRSVKLTTPPRTIPPRTTYSLRLFG